MFGKEFELVEMESGLWKLMSLLLSHLEIGRYDKEHELMLKKNGAKSERPHFIRQFSQIVFLIFSFLCLILCR